jgi:hypothetical protein
MGRNSVDATKACLILAILAERAALPARLAGFLPFAAGLAGALVVFDFDVAEAAGFAGEVGGLAELCGEAGRTAISVESAHARQRETSGAGVGEVAALMFPL